MAPSEAGRPRAGAARILLALAALALGGCDPGGPVAPAPAPASPEAAPAAPQPVSLEPVSPEPAGTDETPSTAPSRARAEPAPPAAGKPAPPVAGEPPVDPEQERLFARTLGRNYADRWFYYPKDGGGLKLMEIENKAAAPLTLGEWVGDPGQIAAVQVQLAGGDLAGLRGHVVLLTFWSTDSSPDVRNLVRNKDLVDLYRDRGLVVIGIHNSEFGTALMRSASVTHAFNFPTVFDVEHQTENRYKVGLWPCHVAIDHQGIVRAAGIRTPFVGDVVLDLLQKQEAEAKGLAEEPFAVPARPE